MSSPNPAPTEPERLVRLSEIPTELRNLRAEIDRWREAHARELTRANQMERERNQAREARDAARQTCDDLTDHCERQGGRIARLEEQLRQLREDTGWSPCARLPQRDTGVYLTRQQAIGTPAESWGSYRLVRWHEDRFRLDGRERSGTASNSVAVHTQMNLEGARAFVAGCCPRVDVDAMEIQR